MSDRETKREAERRLNTADDVLYSLARINRRLSRLEERVDKMGQVGGMAFADLDAAEEAIDQLTERVERLEKELECVIPEDEKTRVDFLYTRLNDHETLIGQFIERLEAVEHGEFMTPTDQPAEECEPDWIDLAIADAINAENPADEAVAMDKIKATIKRLEEENEWYEGEVSRLTDMLSLRRETLQGPLKREIDRLRTNLTEARALLETAWGLLGDFPLTQERIRQFLKGGDADDRGQTAPDVTTAGECTCFCDHPDSPDDPNCPQHGTPGEEDGGL